MTELARLAVLESGRTRGAGPRGRGDLNRTDQLAVTAVLVHLPRPPGRGTPARPTRCSPSRSPSWVTCTAALVAAAMAARADGRLARMAPCAGPGLTVACEAAGLAVVGPGQRGPAQSAPAASGLAEARGRVRAVGLRRRRDTEGPRRSRRTCSADAHGVTWSLGCARPRSATTGTCCSPSRPPRTCPASSTRPSRPPRASWSARSGTSVPPSSASSSTGPAKRSGWSRWTRWRAPSTPWSRSAPAPASSVSGCGWPAASAWTRTPTARRGLGRRGPAARPGPGPRPRPHRRGRDLSPPRRHRGQGRLQPAPGDHVDAVSTP